MTTAISVCKDTIAINQVVTVKDLSVDQLKNLKGEIDKILNEKAIDKKTEEYKALSAEFKALDKEMKTFTNKRFSLKLNVPIVIDYGIDGTFELNDFDLNRDIEPDDLYTEGTISLGKTDDLTNLSKKQIKSLSDHISSHLSGVCNYFLEDFCSPEFNNEQAELLKKIKAWRAKVKKSKYNVADFDN